MGLAKGGLNQSVDILEAAVKGTFSGVHEVEDGLVATGHAAINVGDKVGDMTLEEAEAMANRVLAFIRNRVNDLPDPL